MEDDIRQLMAEAVGAMDAILVALQVETRGERSTYPLDEAVRRLNRLRRAIEETGATAARP
jgi:hypothetical protein